MSIKPAAGHVFNFYPASVAQLDHGYTGRINTKYGRENLDRAIAFMKQRAGAPSSPAIDVATRPRSEK